MRHNAAELEPAPIQSDQLALPLLLRFGGEGAFPAPFPLAMADLNDDGIPDLVTDFGVLVSTPPTSPPPLPAIEEVVYELRYLFDGAPAAEVRIADFNDNGRPDVIGILEGERELVFLNGTGGGLFAEYRIPTSGQASRLAVGDFDGDLLLDVAFRVVGSLGAQPGDAIGDALSICFGNGHGAPTDPVSMGRLATIDQVVAASPSYGITDGIDDLVVVSHVTGGGATSLAVLSGTSGRQLLSPFVLARDEEGTPVVDIPIAVVGGEFDGSAAHRDLAAIAWMGGAAVQPDGAGAVQPDGAGAVQPDGAGAGQADGGGELTLWLLPSTGEAAIAVGDVTSTIYSEGGYIDTPLVAAVDLDGDGTDEMVALYTGWDGDTGAIGQLVVFAVQEQDGVRSWKSRGPPQNLDETYAGGFGVGIGAPEPVAGTEGSGDAEQPVEWIPYQGHVEIGDVNGDRLPDLVALGMTGVYEPEYKTWTNVVVFLNDGSGGLVGAQRIVLPNDATGSPTGFTMADVDRDAGDELVILTFDGAYLADVERPASEWTRLDGVRGGLSLAAGDFDHDGVTDLSVGEPAGIFTFLGKSYLP